MKEDALIIQHIPDGACLHLASTNLTFAAVRLSVPLVVVLGRATCNVRTCRKVLCNNLSFYILFHDCKYFDFDAYVL